MDSNRIYTRPRVLASLAIGTFALLALVFSILTITSREWAVRSEHSEIQQDWSAGNVAWTEYRSPFIVCRAYEKIANTTSDNTTMTSDTSDSTTDSTAPKVWGESCYHFRPFGRNATSCESQNVTVSDNPDDVVNLGDARFCQQIHYAGNFGIASTTFIGLGLLMTLGMAIYTLFGSQPSSSSDSSAYESEPKAPSQPSVMGSYGNLALVTFLFVGVATGLISQFYGIIGLIQSFRGQGDYASSTGGGRFDEPWVQGVALSTYATLAWSFAAAAGTLAIMVWRLPQWNAWE